MTMKEMQDMMKKQAAMMAKFMEKGENKAFETEMVVAERTRDHNARSNEKKKKQKR